jgi:hypothetical protein
LSLSPRHRHRATVAIAAHRLNAISNRNLYDTLLCHYCVTTATVPSPQRKVHLPLYIATSALTPASSRRHRRRRHSAASPPSRQHRFQQNRLLTAAACEADAVVDTSLQLFHPPADCLHTAALAQAANSSVAQLLSTIIMSGFSLRPMGGPHPRTSLAVRRLM